MFIALRSPSNENKISHGWRRRAWLAMDVLKSSEIYAPERPAVGCIAWLDGGVAFGHRVQVYLSSSFFVLWNPILLISRRSNENLLVEQSKINQKLSSECCPDS